MNVYGRRSASLTIHLGFAYKMEDRSNHGEHGGTAESVSFPCSPWLLSLVPIPSGPI
jgi:hypothetical protein